MDTLYALSPPDWDLDRTVWVWLSTSASLVWIEKQNLRAAAQPGQHLKSDCPGKYLTDILRGHILLQVRLLLLLSLTFPGAFLDFFVAVATQESFKPYQRKVIRKYVVMNINQSFKSLNQRTHETLIKHSFATKTYRHWVFAVYIDFSSSGLAWLCWPKKNTKYNFLTVWLSEERRKRDSVRNILK